jgi:hypothetical protein
MKKLTSIFLSTLLLTSSVSAFAVGEASDDQVMCDAISETGLEKSATESSNSSEPAASQSASGI